METFLSIILFIFCMDVGKEISEKLKVDSNGQLEIIIWGKDLAEPVFNECLNEFIHPINRSLPDGLIKKPENIKITYVCGPKLVEYNHLDHVFQKDYPQANILAGQKISVLGEYGNPILDSICADPENVSLYLLPARTPIRTVVSRTQGDEDGKEYCFELHEQSYTLDSMIYGIEGEIAPPKYCSKSFTSKLNEVKLRKTLSHSFRFINEVFEEVLPHIQKSHSATQITKEMIESGEYKAHMINYKNPKRIQGSWRAMGFGMYMNSLRAETEDCLKGIDFSPGFNRFGSLKLIRN